VKREPAFTTCTAAAPRRSVGALECDDGGGGDERHSIGEAGAARMLWLRGRGLRALQDAARTELPRVRQ
jgi:hypothetical protein